MDEKRKLKVLDKIDEIVEKQVTSKFVHEISSPGQTNPIYKNLAKFNNSKIGDKWSVKDLLKS